MHLFPFTREDASADFFHDGSTCSPGRIITNGGSNGGLLVAAVANQAPEGLIGAHVADVGVLDLLNVSPRLPSRRTILRD